MSTNGGGSDPYNGTIPPGNSLPFVGSNASNGSGNVLIGQDLSVNSQWENSFVVKAKEFIMQDPESGEEINISATLKALQERLLILTPNFEAMEEYPALKDAYEQYKMLEKLLIENNKSK